jgi:hypothetical protein
MFSTPKCASLNSYSSRATRSAREFWDGEMAERLNAPVLKTGDLSRGPWVRIPLSPPFFKFESVFPALNLLRSFSKTWRPSMDLRLPSWQTLLTFWKKILVNQGRGVRIEFEKWRRDERHKNNVYSLMGSPAPWIGRCGASTKCWRACRGSGLTE